MSKKYFYVTAFSIATLLITQTVQADADNNFIDFLQKTTVHGDIRIYNFARNYSNSSDINGPSDQHATSAGGNIRILTAPFLSGFQIGLGYYTAQGLGLNNDNPQKVDKSLPSFSVNALGQAYLQYQRQNFLIRLGNQLLDTPWMNASDSRLIPATYQGLYATYNLQPDFTLTGMRILRFKSRTSNDFIQSNLYNPVNLAGGITNYGTTSTFGVLAFGAQYKKNNLATQGWYYNFYNLAKLAYLETQYTANWQHIIKPLMGAQLIREWGNGENLLAPLAGGVANTLGYGLKLGANIAQANFTVGYNYIPAHNNAFKQGNILSPYTAGYTSDPLYTTSMIAGLIEKTSGQALKISGSYYAFDRQLQLLASYAKYWTAPRTDNTSEVDFDVTYKFQPYWLNGLSVRNRVGILNGDPTKKHFIFNRLMVQYSF